MNMTADDILHFWFDELQPAQWWGKDSALDARMTERFSTVHTQANRGELWYWRVDARGRLAEIMVLDQFSRNMFRGTPRAFASDALALILAQEAIGQNLHMQLPEQMRGFMFLPFMHSESLAMHDLAVRLYTELGDAAQLEFEFKHKTIIERFGRYPHRNTILGRVSTAEEAQFLQQPNSAF